jgi:L-malate glycosyltransferase
VVATELGKALVEKGHQVHFITYSQSVRLEYFSETLYIMRFLFPIIHCLNISLMN